MNLDEIILKAKDKSKKIFDKAELNLPENIEISGLAYNSAKVENGFIFFAIKGYKALL